MNKIILLLLLTLAGCANSAHLIGLPCGVPGQTACRDNFVQVCTSGGWRDVDNCTEYGLRCGLVFESGREVMSCKSDDSE